MASGNTLNIFKPAGNQPPSSNAAVLDTRNGHLILKFEDTTAKSAIWGDVLPRNYAGTTGVTVRVCWMAATAASGDVVWGGSFEQHDDEGTDLDSDSFAAEQTVTSSAPATNGAVQYADITFTDGAQMDSLAIGESFRFKLRRVATSGSDNMSGDAQVLRVEIRET